MVAREKGVCREQFQQTKHRGPLALDFDSNSRLYRLLVDRSVGSRTENRVPNCNGLVVSFHDSAAVHPDQGP
jgi:hypothetical protein